MNQLPDKLSDCLELALGDLEKCERSKRYRIDMIEWHNPVAETCYVCLAGSVIARALA